MVQQSCWHVPNVVGEASRGPVRAGSPLAGLFIAAISPSAKASTWSPGDALSQSLQGAWRPVGDLVLGTGVIPFHAGVLTDPTTLETLSNTVEFTLAAILMRRWLGRGSALERPAHAALLAALRTGHRAAARDRAMSCGESAPALAGALAPDVRRPTWLDHT